MPIKFTLTLPEGFSPEALTGLPKTVPVTLNFDHARPIGMAALRLEDGVVVGELNVEASVAVRRFPGEGGEPMEVGFVHATPCQSCGAALFYDTVLQCWTDRTGTTQCPAASVHLPKQ